MDPSIRANRSRVIWLVIAGIFVGPGVVCARQEPKSVEPAVTQKQITNVQTDSTMAPLRKTDWVRTDDPIALLAVGNAEDFKGAPLRGGSALPETSKAGECSGAWRGGEKE